MTKNTDYTAIDSAILRAIGDGRVRASTIEVSAHVEAKAAVNGPNDSTMRVIDRRLQALKRAGQIRFESAAGWSIE